MFRRILNVMRRDFKSNLRDTMVVYLLIAPIMLAFLLKIFIPAANSASLQFAVLDDEVKLIAQLERYGKVESFETVEDLEQRVNKTDDITGILVDGDSYQIILEGNEPKGTKDAVENILMDHEGMLDNLPLKIKMSELGWEISQIALIGGISIILMSTVLGGMLSGLNIVEERQMKTIRAMKVSPVTTSEFILAKSIPGVIIPLLQSLATLFILGLTDINWWMAVIMIAATSLIGLIVGFVIGVMNEDPIMALSSIKMLFLPVTASVLGALLLPQKWMWVVYWSPFYWTYKGVSEVVLKTATWGNTLLYSAIILGITLLVYLGLFKKVKRGLA